MSDDPTLAAAADEEPLFDPSLKKKKKKKVLFNEDPLGEGLDEPSSVKEPSAAPAEPGPSILKPVEEGGDDKEVDDLTAMFGDLKKKKKKKKEIPMDLDEEASTPVGADADGLDDFSDLKKKKSKKSKKATFDLEEFEKQLGDSTPATAGDDVEGEVAGDDEDLGENVFALPDAPVQGGDEKDAWLGSDRDYTYSELLGRIFRTLHAQNPDLSSASRRRYTIVPPSVHREGNKKSIFANVADICKRMRRPSEHVIQFLFAELGTTGSVDGEKRLVIKGRFQQKQIENVLRRYIVEYVTCKTCKSPDTLLDKENRIYFVSCESCGSRRSVSAIKTGFQAQVGKRPRK